MAGDDEEEVSNKEVKLMFKQVLGKLDTLGTKVDSSMALAKEARADAAAAKQSNVETRLAVAALEKDMTDMKQEVQVMKGNAHKAPLTTPLRPAAPGSRSGGAREWTAMVFGFEQDTLADDIEATLKYIQKELNLLKVVECRSLGYRKDRGTIKFEDKESMEDFLDKSLPNISSTCDGIEVKLKAKVFRTAQDQKETKEIRTLAYVLRKHMKFEGRDKKVLDLDFFHQSVFIKNKRIAEFKEDGGGKLRGRVDRSKHQFVIDEPSLQTLTAELGYPVDAAAVVAEFKQSIVD